MTRKPPTEKNMADINEEIPEGIKEEIRRKKAFIFDMDGTIVDLEQLNYRGYADTLKKFFNIDLSNDDYQRFFSGKRTKEGFDGVLADRKVSEYDVDELISDFRKGKRYNLENHPDEVIKLKDGVPDLLHFLKNRCYPTCLATSSVREFATLILKHFDLEKLFDFTLTAEDVSEGKPSPQIYNIAVERVGVDKQEAVVFEDSRNGIASAKSAGILCVGVLTEGLNDSYVNSADFVIRDFTKILSFLKK
ncbi:HAD family phosphatase [Candidatus Dojkabacteria bacterium]|nr:HAD family phosphatase [Candidatus Dojkabacteria bacterium]